MTSPPPAETGVRLHVEADLLFSLASTEGRLSGAGSELEFVTDDLAPFLAGASSAQVRVREIGPRLAQAGLTVDVIERGRRTVSFGSGQTSLLGRLIGLRNVTAHRPFRLVRLAVRRS